MKDNEENATKIYSNLRKNFAWAAENRQCRFTDNVLCCTCGAGVGGCLCEFLGVEWRIFVLEYTELN